MTYNYMLAQVSFERVAEGGPVCGHAKPQRCGQPHLLNTLSCRACGGSGSRERDRGAVIGPMASRRLCSTRAAPTHPGRRMTPRGDPSTRTGAGRPRRAPCRRRWTSETPRVDKADGGSVLNGACSIAGAHGLLKLCCRCFVRCLCLQSRDSGKGRRASMPVAVPRGSMHRSVQGRAGDHCPGHAAPGAAGRQSGRKIAEWRGRRVEPPLAAGVAQRGGVEGRRGGATWEE